MEKKVICFRGEQESWNLFTIALRRDKKKVWDVIGPAVKEYLEKKRGK